MDTIRMNIPTNHTSPLERRAVALSRQYGLDLAKTRQMLIERKIR